MRPPIWLIAAAACAVVWIFTAALPWAARALTALLVGAMPIFAVAQLRTLADPTELPRMAAYASTAITLWALAALTAGASFASAYSRTELGLAFIPASRILPWSAGITMTAVAATLLLRRMGIEESPLLRHLLPQTTRERFAFAGLSVTAGVCEELIFRGFLLVALTRASGSVLAAVAVSTLVFGWAHAYQQAAGAVRAGTLGLLLALPPVFAGTIIPSMIAHTCIDLIGGLWLRDRAAK